MFIKELIMSEEKWFTLLLENQNEMKGDIKEVISEVRKINGRVTKLESDNSWHLKYIDWSWKLALVGAGFVVGFVLEHFLKL